METTTGPPRKKRGYTANIRQRERRNNDGSTTTFWEARPYVKDGYGRVKRVSLSARTLDEVKDKIREEESKNTASFDAEKETVGTYLERWLDTRVRNHRAFRTYELYKSTIDRLLRPNLDAVTLQKLTSGHIADLVNVKLEKVGSRARQIAYGVLHAALEDAIGDRLITSNPAHKKLKPRHVIKKYATLSAEEGLKLLAAARNSHHYDLILLALTTGMREGEILGLRWSDVDLDAARLTVQATLTRGADGKLFRGEPKASRRRTIDLPNITRDALHTRQLTQNPASQWVFTDELGQPIKKDLFLRKTFRPMLKAAGVPPIRFHDLRHTHATLLLGAGANVKVVSERLGHSSAKMTMDVYAHAMPTLQRQAIETIDSMFASPQTQWGISGGFSDVGTDPKTAETQIQ